MDERINRLMAMCRRLCQVIGEVKDIDEFRTLTSDALACLDNAKSAGNTVAVALFSHPRGRSMVDQMRHAQKRLSRTAGLNDVVKEKVGAFKANTLLDSESLLDCNMADFKSLLGQWKEVALVGIGQGKGGQCDLARGVLCEEDCEVSHRSYGIDKHLGDEQSCQFSRFWVNLTHGRRVVRLGFMPKAAYTFTYMCIYQRSFLSSLYSIMLL